MLRTHIKIQMRCHSSVIPVLERRRLGVEVGVGGSLWPVRLA